jgi:phosphomethylpyrimidine synthase
LSFTTQMDAARRGIITREMQAVADRELVEPEKLRKLVAEGKVVIPANKNHGSLEPCGIGEGLRTKINVNLGISKDCCNIETELEKVRKALELKADAIMDLSCYGKTEEFRRRLVEMSPAAIGTVPVYDAVDYTIKNWKK